MFMLSKHCINKVIVYAKFYFLVINENVRITDHPSGIRLLDCSKSAVSQENGNDTIICWHEVISNFFDVVVFYLSSLVTDPSFMSISLLVLEL